MVLALIPMVQFHEYIYHQQHLLYLHHLLLHAFVGQYVV
nr:MAG TPA: hypothetical protein [Caudoviricetes sp.]